MTGPTTQSEHLPAVGAILSGPFWPGRVRVVRVEPRREGRALVEAVTLDEQSRLISRNFSAEELAQLRVEAAAGQRTLDGARVNGVGTARLPNTTSLTLPGVDVDAILLNMPAVMLGVGSACSAGALEPSHVLQAIGLSRSDAGSTVRISLGRFNVADEIPVVVDEIVRAVSIANGGDREGN